MADVQIAVIDQQNTQLALAAPEETQVNIAVPGVQGPTGEGVPSGGSANQVLFKQSGTNYDTAWGNVTSAMIGDLEIVNADVAAAAAIAGTKISPNFGSQNVITTGTSTAASFIPTSSTVPTNGVYLPAANSVALATNGQGRLFVDASGRVGIGTQTPTALLDIAATSPQILLTDTDGNAVHSLAGLGNGSLRISVDAVNGGTAASALEMYVDGTERARIDSSGTFRVRGNISNTPGTNDAVQLNGSAPANSLLLDASGRLGLGTSSPASLLHLAAINTNPPELKIQNTSSSTGDTASISFTMSSVAGAAGALIRAERLGASAQSELSFWTGSAGGTNVRALTIDQSQRVGIGTSSPGALLHVSGGNVCFGNTGSGFPYGPTDTISFIPAEGLISLGGDGRDTVVTGQAGCYIWSGSGAGGSFPSGTLALQSRSNVDRPIVFITGSTPAERVRIDGSGRVGIGTTPSYKLHIADGTFNEAVIDGSTSGGGWAVARNGTKGGGVYNTGLWAGDSTTGTSLTTTTGNELRFYIGSTPAARIDSSGRLLVGTATARSNFFNSIVTTQFQIEGTSFDNSSQAITRNSNDIFAPGIVFAKSRGTTIGSNTIVQNGATPDILGSISFQGNDGNQFVEGANIKAETDGAVGANDMPSKLVFSVTADGSASPTEALRISSNRAITVSDGGNVVLGTTTGTKIGTATSQKLGFYNATPVVQPTTGVAEAAFVENSGGTAVNVDSTFGGYTIQQVVQALQTLGLLA